MSHDRLLGWPLDAALQELAAQGLHPGVDFIAPPHGDAQGRVWRVVRVGQGGETLAVCAFLHTVAQDGQKIE
ncbi:MAG: hypothetical protein LBU67_00095 [Oscillospiraceae bacterium]|jgi:hypothetical protein|nr:hypothetical protein [Oscillospiraceae bacterium]